MRTEAELRRMRRVREREPGQHGIPIGALFFAVPAFIALGLFVMAVVAYVFGVHGVDSVFDAL